MWTYPVYEYLLFDLLYESLTTGCWEKENQVCVSILCSNVYSVGLFNPFTAKGNLIDFTLSNVNRFYSSKGDPLAVKGLKNYLLTLSQPRVT